MKDLTDIANWMYKNILKSDFLGWFGSLLVIFGYFLNANMHSSSWLGWIVGNGFVAVYCFNKKAYPTFFMSLIIMIMNIYGYYNWIR